MTKTLASPALRGGIDLVVTRTFQLLTGNGRSLEEEYDPEPYDIAYTFFAIITVLILVTILFETIKDYMIDASDKYTR
jgi:hypothetical protein